MSTQSESQTGSDESSILAGTDIATETDSLRKEVFEAAAENKTHQLFHIPGLNIRKFTHKRITFTFQPSLIYHHISQTYLFLCSLRYLELYGKWIIKKEPIPTICISQKATFGEIFIDDDIDSIARVIFEIYKYLQKASKDEIKYRRNKYKRYRAGVLSDLYVDSIDEEIYFTDEERKELFEKRLKIWKRMLPPTPKQKRVRRNV